MKPQVLIVGLGETGSQLARRLCQNWQVTVVDLQPEAFARAAIDECKHHIGDGTSAFVLRRAGAEQIGTLVATTGEDESNLEVLRIAKQGLGIENLYASMLSGENEASYRELGVQVVDRHLSCSAQLEARLEGRAVASGIGLGTGEIVEVEVLPNSSVIGQRLAELRPRRWLVGAVYRAGELIVPHGDTVIAEGDRVLIIGEPEIISSIATLIGTGQSKFPLHYGSRVVAFNHPGLPALLAEARYLLENTAASHFEVIGRPHEALDPEVQRCCDGSGLPLTFVKAGLPGELALAEEAVRRDVGILLLPSAPLSLWCRAGLQRSATVQLIDLFQRPVLIGRGTFPYQRVVLGLFELPFPLSAAQLAIDSVRMMGGRLVLTVVKQPKLVVGSQLHEELDEKRRQVEKLASMYHVSLQVEVIEGNPIHQLEERSERCDLMVLPYRRHRRSSLTNPDICQNLIHRARCSTLVMPD